MKKNLLLVLMFITGLISAQITITSTNVPSANDTARLSLASVSQLTGSLVTNYQLSGPNFTWNFDSLKPIGQVMRKFEPASTYGYFSSGFCEKTADSMNLFIATLTNVCDIYKKTTSSFYVDAWGITVMNFPLPVPYASGKKDQLYLFPLNYLDRDSTNFSMSTPSFSIMPFGYEKNGHRITEVDGYGTIKTPYGTEQCLRVVTTQYSIDSIHAMIPIGTFTLPLNIGYPNYVRKYQWLTLNEKVPYLEIAGTVLFNNFVPNEVRYRDNIRYFAGIQESSKNEIAQSVYPNPASNELFFKIERNGNYEISIYDMQGRELVKKQIENNGLEANKVDISHIESGIYAGKITEGKTVQNFKLIKQ